MTLTRVYEYVLLQILLISISGSDGASRSCDPFDDSKIWVGDECKCNTTGGCYQPRGRGTCIKMKECPAGQEPNQWTNECLYCQVGSFSSSKDCMACSLWTKCKDSETEIFPGNRSVDTICGPALNVLSTSQAYIETKTAHFTTPPEHLESDIKNSTEETGIREESTTHQTPPIEQRVSSSLIRLLFIIGVCPMLVITPIIVFMVKGIRQSRRGQNGPEVEDEQTSEKVPAQDQTEPPLETHLLISATVTPIEEMTSPPPYSTRDYLPQNTPREAITAPQQTTSLTYVKIPVPSESLLSAPSLNSLADSSVETVRVPNGSYHLTTGRFGSLSNIV